MPVDFKTEVEGLRGLEKSLRVLAKDFADPKYALQALRPAIKKALEPLVSYIKFNTPKDTGKLSESTQLKVGKPNKKEKSNPDIGKDAVLLGKVGWFWRTAEGSLWRQALSVEFGNAKTIAQPVLRKALEDNHKNMLQTFKEQLKIAIDRKAKALRKKYNK